MFQLKGFFSFSPLIDNARDEVAPFGEISSDSLTYAKDKTFHTNDATPQTTLIVFSSQDSTGYVPTPNPLAVTTLQVGQWLLDRAVSGTLVADPSVMLSNIQAEFSTLISDVSSGEIKESGGIRLPEWVRFSVVSEPDSDVMVWLADESFQRQYTGYHIEVVPPIWPLDDFFKDPIQVKALLSEYDLVEKINEVQTARGEYPYTQLIARQYDYTDPLGVVSPVPTNWMLMIYGQAGNNPDLIRNTLIDYILDNSDHTREEWTEILPDLFLTTEFIITPFWTHYGVPNRELQAGIYSPTVKPKDVVPILKQTTQGPKYTETWIEEEYKLSNLIYKSLAFGVVGNPQNRDGITSFYEKFPDYLVVTNDSSDYNRMSVYTQEFFTLLGEMTRVAENLHDMADVPVGMARLTRNGVEYITALYDDVTYLMVGKPYLEELMGV